jgi:hypothetical protein
MSLDIKKMASESRKNTSAIDEVIGGVKLEKKVSH